MAATALEARMVAQRALLAESARRVAAVEDEVARVLGVRAETAPSRAAELTARADEARHFATAERALADRYDASSD